MKKLVDYAYSMPIIHKEYFPSWPYDDALSWMLSAHQQVYTNNHKIFLACGSHREKVVTLGRDFAKNGIDEELIGTQPGTLIRAIDRGGGATAHEPGQLVLYPVLHLACQKLSPTRLVDILQECMLLFLKNLGLCGQKDVNGPGIFIEGQKVGFIGMRIKSGISTHGIAINIFNDCRTFSLFDPCGIKAMPITSLKNHLKLERSDNELMTDLVDCFLGVFLR